jgi:hypothetical protein
MRQWRLGPPGLGGLRTYPLSGFAGLVGVPVFGAVPLGVLGAPGAVGFEGCLAPAGDPGVAGLVPGGMVGRDDPDGGGVDERCGPDGIVGVPGLDCACDVGDRAGVCAPASVDEPADVDEADAVPGVVGVDAPPDVPDVPGIDAVPGVPGVDAPPDAADAPGIDDAAVPGALGVVTPPDEPDVPMPGGLDVGADDEGADVDDGRTVAEGCGEGACGGGAAGALNVPVDEFVFCGGTGADGGKTSTDRVNVRFSAACSAPTLTTWRVTSSPRSLRMAMITKYSSGCSFGGCRMIPSTRNAGAAATCRFAASESKRRWCMQPGQILRLSRIVALQCGQVRVLPVDTGREATLMNRCRIPWQWSYGLRYPNRIRPGRASASPPQRSVIQPSRRR